MSTVQPGAISLLSGLGGDAGFGENILPANDDLSTSQIDLSPIFEDGINFFGNVYRGVWINNNGSITFDAPRAAFTPDVITGISNNPEITPFFGDVDTRGDAVGATAGGNSTGSNLVYYDFNEVTDQFIVTWDDVGYYEMRTDKLNAFQLILTDQGNGDFDIEFRYEDINWTTGEASGGIDGLGGEVARAGYTAGTGADGTFFELPASGNQDAILALDETEGNTGLTGRWKFPVRNGGIVESIVPLLSDDVTGAWTTGDPHLSTLDGVNYDFHAAGEYILLRDADGGDFAIQARMTPVGENASVNAAVATNLSGRSVMIDGTDPVPLSIDGVPVEVSDFSFVQVGNDRVYREGDTYIAVYAGEDGEVGNGDSQLRVTVFDGRVDIDIRLNTSLLGRLEGLLGDGDGNQTNDVALADGTPLARPFAFEDLYGQYRTDWRVADESESLFAYDDGESPSGFYLEDYPGELVTLDMLDAEVRAASEQAARNAGLVPGTASFDNAVLDFALTNDPSFLVSALNTPEENESVERILGTGAADLLTGGADVSAVFGRAGDDILIGNDGADRLFGEEGDDLLIGGSVRDVSTQDDARIYRLYEATLGRAPDTAGFENWTDRLASGEMQLSEIVSGFVRSREFQNTYGSLDDQGFVSLLYNNVLDRAPDQTGLNNWTARLEDGMSRERVVLGFSESAEFKIQTNAGAFAYSDSGVAAPHADDVYRLYRATLGREPDFAGLENWAGRLGAGTDFLAVTGGFVNSREFQNTYGDLGNAEFVSLLYNNVLGRSADAAGLENWTTRLDDGMTREAVVRGFSQSREFVIGTEDEFRSYMAAVEGDTFRGGAGDDLIYGGLGADTFIFGAADAGRDRVLQLDAWDTLSFTGFGYSDASEAVANMQSTGQDTVFSHDDVSITFMRTEIGLFEDLNILV
ncbi:DUF4214 domain-containing protein [Limimaricola pyoseonensis]|uniref:Hemolysin-type calcium-binding repeat-containing protein n=1 Tax=Limimaricola pyoseonensis TaxID=521013 RepID=A0A1G7IGB6_9RHOB|nr:DUF4214 domain-containing protein [Limimaricola pyoseonensis]SDF11790.1 Hemolysin-type calcium-binding repeat-containing protein [Limimaricola pyoseonensis]